MLLGLCGAADVRNPGGNLTWTRVNMVGFHSGLANGLVVKYSLTPIQKIEEINEAAHMKMLSHMRTAKAQASLQICAVLPELSLLDHIIWATTWQNQQCDCAPSEDSDQPGHPPSLISLRCVLEETLGP